MNYLLMAAKIVACSAVFYCYYRLFLQNRKFHRYNRFFLVSAVVLSFLLPLVKLPVFDTAIPGPIVYESLQLVTWGEYHEVERLSSATPTDIPITAILKALYFAGSGIFLWLLIKAYAYIQSLRLKFPGERLNDITIHQTTEEGTPFSFFKSVFWNRKIDLYSEPGQKIFKHELFHIRQMHSLDVLLSEMAIVIAWFNPFFHLIRKELKAIHEFLADEYAADKNDPHAYAELLVLQAIGMKQSQLVHPFFHNHIKRRIKMITRFNTRSGYWSRILILPVAVILFCFISLNAQQHSGGSNSELKLNANEKPLVLMIDAGHGGADPGAKSADGKYSEKEIALAIAQKLRTEAEAAGMSVLMSRTEDVSLNVQERSNLNTSQKPDLFVSIHVGAGPKPLDNSIGGAEAYIGSKKQQSRGESIEMGNSILNALKPLMKVSTPVKERKNGGIWVLDHSPCPGIVIHCGFMTNENDVTFITDESNQQKIAKRILQGIISFQNRTSQIKPSYKSEYQAGKTRNLLVRNFIKKIRYPLEGSQNNEENEIYFSLKVHQNSGISDLTFYNSYNALKPMKVNEIVIVSGYNKKKGNEKKSHSEDTHQQMFIEEIKKTTHAIQNEIDFSDYESGHYLFKVSFRIENPSNQVVTQ